MQGCQVDESVQTLGARRTVSENRSHYIKILTTSFVGLAKCVFEEYIGH